MQGPDIADTNEDGRVTVLDSVLLLDKVVSEGTRQSQCTCDPTYNGQSTLNDFNLISLATVPSLMMLDHRGMFGGMDCHDASTSIHRDLIVVVPMKSAGCVADATCSEFHAAFAESTVNVLIALDSNAAVEVGSTWSQTAGLGSTIGCSTTVVSGGGIKQLHIISAENTGDGVFETRLRHQSSAPFVGDPPL